MGSPGAKRALIVDDSRSARAFLSHILEKYQIEVDTAESAEHALQYLGSHRPDVIFMDHLMPGMDGFQAVQAIKNNPRTATIPIMMYTSQEGELYLGQARALGAVGVLPKQIKPADVSKVLYELHLVPERRSPEPGAFRPVAVEPPAAAPAAKPREPVAPAPRPLTDAVLREQFAELRRMLVANLDTHSERITADVRETLRGALPSPLMLEPTARGAPWGWIAAVGILFAALAAVAALWWQQGQELSNLRARVAQLEQARVAAPAAAADGDLVPSAPTTGVEIESPQFPTASPANDAPLAAGEAAVPAIAPIQSEVLQVPYGEVPLAGERLDRIRSTLQRLAAAQHRGAVEVFVFAGRFCLAAGAGGPALALGDLPAASCDIVGNPAMDALTDFERVPPDLVALAEEVRSGSAGALELRLVGGDPDQVVEPYPAETESLTAGEWNGAAAANNRIEIRIR
jgi:CheY-like chemotaxis protein